MKLGYILRPACQRVHRYNRLKGTILPGPIEPDPPECLHQSFDRKRCTVQVAVEYLRPQLRMRSWHAAADHVRKKGIDRIPIVAEIVLVHDIVFVHLTRYQDGPS